MKKDISQAESGAKLIVDSNKNASLFIKPSTDMEIDNFQRLVRIITGNLNKLNKKNRLGKSKSKIADDAMSIAMNLDPDGYKALETRVDLAEQFRISDDDE